MGLPEDDEELLDDDELLDEELLDDELLDDELLEDELFDDELLELEDELELPDEDEELPPHPPINNATAHKGKSILFIEIT